MAASAQDAQLTHVLEILQDHTKHISARLEAFHDRLISNVNRYDHSIQDATLRIEIIIIQLKNAESMIKKEKSVLFVAENTKKKKFQTVDPNFQLDPLAEE